MTLRNITLERREKTRKVPEQFAFLQLEQDDGGRVLDISEGGLRFESFAPVQEHGPLHFWFSLNLRERIEAWGELAWTDAARKSGGLKFVNLSEGGRDQIREYLGHSIPNRILPEVATREGDAVSSFVSRARPRQSTLFLGKRETAAASIPFPAKAEAGVSDVLVPMQRHLAAMRRQLIIGLLIGASVSGVVAFAAIEISRDFHENRAPAKSTVELPVQTVPASSPPPVIPSVVNDAQRDVFAISNQKKSAPMARTPASAPVDAAAHTAKQKNPPTPDQLWTLVQGGNSTAAASLAELYIKGEGVPQNCAQARVLLLLAADKHNAAATRRLAELDKQGCPAN